MNQMPLGVSVKTSACTRSPIRPSPPVTHLAVLLSVIDDEQGGLEIERMHQLEGQTALFNIANVLGGVVDDFHGIYCMHTNSAAQPGRCRALSPRGK